MDTIYEEFPIGSNFLYNEITNSLSFGKFCNKNEDCSSNIMNIGVCDTNINRCLMGCNNNQQCIYNKEKINSEYLLDINKDKVNEDFTSINCIPFHNSNIGFCPTGPIECKNNNDCTNRLCNFQSDCGTSCINGRCNYIGNYDNYSNLNYNTKIDHNYCKKI